MYSNIVTINLTGSPLGHQTVLLSATISKGVEDLSELSLKDPIHIDIGNFIYLFIVLHL